MFDVYIQPNKDRFSTKPEQNVHKPLVPKSREPGQVAYNPLGQLRSMVSCGVSKIRGPGQEWMYDDQMNMVSL